MEKAGSCIMEFQNHSSSECHYHPNQNPCHFLCFPSLLISSIYMEFIMVSYQIKIFPSHSPCLINNFPWTTLHKWNFLFFPQHSLCVCNFCFVYHGPDTARWPDDMAHGIRTLISQWFYGTAIPNSLPLLNYWFTLIYTPQHCRWNFLEIELHNTYIHKTLI